MAVQFYNVKKKCKVSIAEDQIQKVKYEKKTKEGKIRVSYGLRAEDEGTKLTKFVSETDWKNLDAPVVA